MYDITPYENLYETDMAGLSAIFGMLAGWFVFILIVAIIGLIGLWKVFEKCGKPGWAAIVPIYNLWVLFEIVGMAPWLSLLYLVPIVNFVALICTYIAYFKLAGIFGKGTGYGLGLIFLQPIFICILGFGKDMPTK